MRIFISPKSLHNQHRGRGIGVYTKNLITYLTQLYPDQILTQLDSTSPKPDLIHYPYFDLFSPTLPIYKPTPTVVTIHDVIPLLYPKHFPVGIKGSLAHFHQKISLSTCRAIITDSLASQTDIHHHLSQDPAKIHSIPLAARPDINTPTFTQLKQFRAKYPLPKPVLGYVGDINYNKNLPRLIRAIAQVPQLHLAIVTRAQLDPSIPEARAILKAIQKNKIASRIHFLSIPSATQLACFYKSIDFYIQPSLYEGFGLPVLEAMHQKTPVISSTGGSLKEITTNVAITFNPTKIKSIINAIHRAQFNTKSQTKRLIRQAYQHAKSYTWEQTAKLTHSIYQQVLQPNR